MTLIYELKEGNPEIVKKAEYSIEPYCIRYAEHIS